MSSKDEHAAAVATEHARAAKQDYILKGPKAYTFSATNPPYAYTSLCPDPKLRKRPGPKPEHPEGIQPVVTEKICLICRKHWPSYCKRTTSDCESQGHLYSTGLYYQPKRGGGADGD